MWALLVPTFHAQPWGSLSTPGYLTASSNFIPNPISPLTPSLLFSSFLGNSLLVIKKKTTTVLAIQQWETISRTFRTPLLSDICSLTLTFLGQFLAPPKLSDQRGLEFPVGVGDVLCTFWKEKPFSNLQIKLCEQLSADELSRISYLQKCNKYVQTSPFWLQSNFLFIQIIPKLSFQLPITNLLLLWRVLSLPLEE